jgi:hypothetical protein
MHGPCEVPGFACPSFTDRIDVIDDVLATIDPLRIGKRRRWRRARDKGLAMWEPAGLTFTVTEGPGAYHSYFDPAHALDTYLTPLLVPGVIRIVRDKTPPGGREDYAIWTTTASVCAIDLEKAVTDPIYELPRIVCHEIGHCLGLVHGTRGTPAGVMEGGLEPNAHDLDSLRSYYVEEVTPIQTDP